MLALSFGFLWAWYLFWVWGPFPITFGWPFICFLDAHEDDSGAHPSFYFIGYGMVEWLETLAVWRMLPIALSQATAGRRLTLALIIEMMRAFYHWRIGLMILSVGRDPTGGYVGYPIKLTRDTKMNRTEGSISKVQHIKIEF